MMIRHERPHGDQRLLVTDSSSRMSIGSFLLTPIRKFYGKCRTLMKNSSFLTKNSSVIRRVRSFFRSDTLKRPKDSVISQDTEEKRPTYIVGDTDSTIPESGDFTGHKSADDAHEGLHTAQDQTLGEKSEERPRKRPRDIDAEELFLVHQSPPEKKQKTYPKQDMEASFLNHGTRAMLDTKLVQPDEEAMKASDEAPIASFKRKAQAYEHSQPETLPPAKRAKAEKNTDLATEDQGCLELGTPQAEMSDWNPLSPDHMFNLTNHGYDGMLVDDIVNMAQELLQKQFEDFDGLQPVAALLVPGYRVIQKAVQIHYDEGRMHWLTTCFRNGEILVADSLKTNNLSPFISEQISNIYGAVVQEPLKHLRFLNVDQQRNNYDCGVFAIAFAFELLADDGDPTAMYEHQKMRDHLIFCLQNGRITAFPKIA